MFCRMCGTQLPGGSYYCINCGTPTTLNPNGINAGRGAIPGRFKKSKSWIILALGILSMISLGPLTGIPAAIWGYLDLRKMRRGLVTARGRLRTKLGMILGIIGTFLVPLAIYSFLYYQTEIAIKNLPVVKDSRIKENLISDCKNLGNEAQIYHNRTIPVDDSLGTFEGWEIPLDQASSAAGSYSISDRSRNQLTIKCVPYDSSMTVFVTVTPDTMYTGD